MRVRVIATVRETKRIGVDEEFHIEGNMMTLHENEVKLKNNEDTKVIMSTLE